jgi:hypothetical protein
MSEAKKLFKKAFGGVRALESLPSKTADLIKPDAPRMWYRHGENKAEAVKALMALRDLPPAIIEAAWEARAGQYTSTVRRRGMRTTRELRYHTTAAKREREEDERRWQLRRDQAECAMRGCEQCSEALKNQTA